MLDYCLIRLQKNKTIPIQTTGRLMPVIDLRQLVFKAEKVPIVKQRLVFRGKVMRDYLSDGRRSTLLAYGVGRDHPGKCHPECTHTVVMFPHTKYADKIEYTTPTSPFSYWERG